MISCNDGVVSVFGKRIEVQTEFMILAKAMVAKEVFDSREELLKAISFATADGEEQRAEIMKMLDEAIDFFELAKEKK